VRPTNRPGPSSARDRRRRSGRTRSSCHERRPSESNPAAARERVLRAQRGFTNDTLPQASGEVTIVTRIEKDFGITITDDEAQSIITIEQLVYCVASKLALKR